MIITRLTYFSRNHCDRPGQSPDDGIKDIWIESVANNRRDDITGALIHDHAWFAQVLEGSEAVVSATFERILRDRRHSGIRLVQHGQERGLLVHQSHGGVFERRSHQDRVSGSSRHQ